MYTVFDEKEEKYIKAKEPDPSRTYTYADYLRWRFVERLELLQGKVFQTSGPNTRHQVLSARFSAWLSTSGKFAGLKMYAGGDIISSVAVPDFALDVERLFKK